MKKKDKTKKNGLKKNELARNIIAVFKENPDKTFNYKQLSSLFGIKGDSQRIIVNDILYELRDEDVLDLHDRLATFNNLTLDGLVNDRLAEFVDGELLSGGAHHFNALVPDLALLALLGVARLLLVQLLCEADGEQPQDVTIGSADVDLSIDKRSVLAEK